MRRCSPVIIALLVSPLLLSSCAYIIRASLPPGSICNSTAAFECFKQLYELKREICMGDQSLRFQCVDYKFLDECFTNNAGFCDVSTIGKNAMEAYHVAIGECSKKHTKRYREAMRATAHSSMSQKQGKENTGRLISALGQLQTECVISDSENCTADSVHYSLETCDQRIRSKKITHVGDFDRQKLLRIKLDTSRKLLQYDDTIRYRECLIIRAALSEIYQIHRKHCVHTIVTRCICERSSFGPLCQIDCANLDPKTPEDEELDWSNFRGSLVRSSHSDLFHSFVIIRTFLAMLLLTVVIRPIH